MIKEAYCSFEVAKLLKEKGFNVMVGTYYNNNNKFIFGDYYNWNNSPMGDISAPTHQMAMAWLREVHNLCIEPYRTASGYLYTISKIWTGSELYSAEYEGDDEASGQYTTYEKAVEAAIKYSLKKLI